MGYDGMAKETSPLRCGGAESRSYLLSRTALLIAVGVLVPFLFHQVGIAGKIFLPLHFTVLLTGFLLGPWAGIWVGVLSPTLSFLLTGMPPFPLVLAMVPELATYGFVSGWLYKKGVGVLPSLLVAMAAGRIVLGGAMWGLARILGFSISPLAFVAGAVVTGLPGIVVQIVGIPLLLGRLGKEEVLGLGCPSGDAP